MRSESEIRREVETRLKRRGLLLLHGILWLVISTSLYLYSQFQGVPAGWTISAAMVMAIWLLGVGLHTFWVAYIEVRERAVHRAIEREHEFYGKRKREPVHRLGTDGELSEADGTDWEQDDAERSRNSARS